MGVWARGDKRGTGQDLSSSSGALMWTAFIPSYHCERGFWGAESWRHCSPRNVLCRSKKVDGSLKIPVCFHELGDEVATPEAGVITVILGSLQALINRAETAFAVHCSPVSPSIIWPSLPSGSALSHHPSLWGVAQYRLPLITPD